MNNTHVAPAALSSRADDNLQVANANAVGGTQVVDVGIDSGVPSWLFAEYKKSYANTLDARRFSACSRMVQIRFRLIGGTLVVIPISVREDGDRLFCGDVALAR